MAAANPELAAKSVWDPAATYAEDDIVTARGPAWISLKPGNKNKVPGQTSPSSIRVRHDEAGRVCLDQL